MTTAFDNKATGGGGLSRLSIDKLITDTSSYDGLLLTDKTKIKGEEIRGQDTG